MKRFVVVKSTDRGTTSSSDVIGSWLKDPFFDSYEEESLTSYDILNIASDSRANTITITIDREFLKKIVRSHLKVIISEQKKGSE